MRYSQNRVISWGGTCSCLLYAVSVASGLRATSTQRLKRHEHVDMRVLQKMNATNVSTITSQLSQFATGTFTVGLSVYNDDVNRPLSTSPLVIGCTMAKLICRETDYKVTSEGDNEACGRTVRDSQSSGMLANREAFYIQSSALLTSHLKAIATADGGFLTFEAWELEYKTVFINQSSVATLPIIQKIVQYTTDTRISDKSLDTLLNECALNATDSTNLQLHSSIIGDEINTFAAYIQGQSPSGTTNAVQNQAWYVGWYLWVRASPLRMAGFFTGTMTIAIFVLLLIMTCCHRWHYRQDMDKAQTRGYSLPMRDNISDSTDEDPLRTPMKPTMFAMSVDGSNVQTWSVGDAVSVSRSDRLLNAIDCRSISDSENGENASTSSSSGSSKCVSWADQEQPNHTKQTIFADEPAGVLVRVPLARTQSAPTFVEDGWQRRTRAEAGLPKSIIRKSIHYDSKAITRAPDLKTTASF
jgi:hypothetical protein